MKWLDWLLYWEYGTYTPYPYSISTYSMLPAHKKNVLAALKRLNGLSKKLEQMVEEGEYCQKNLQIALAMKGHIEHIQAQILESHLKTCAAKKLSSSGKDKFIKDLLKVIGLSKR